MRLPRSVRVPLLALSAALMFAGAGCVVDEEVDGAEVGVSEAPAHARIYIVPLAADLAARRIDPEMEVSVAALQGLANRGAPRVYVLSKSPDEVWLREMRQVYFPHYEYVELASTWDLFAIPELREMVGGRLVAYRREDSALAAHVALTAAGVHDAVAVEASNLAGMRQRGYTLDAALDLRRKFSSDIQAQRWAWNNLRDACVDHSYGVMQGNVRGRGGLGKGSDYMVNQRMFVFLLAQQPRFVNGVDTVQLQKKILDDYRPGTIAYGWWGKEVHDIRAISQRGHTFVINGWNHSLHQHLSMGRIRRQPSRENLPRYNPDKTYVFFTFTQGSEAMGFLQNVLHRNWNQQSRTEPGKLIRHRIPFGVMFSSMQEDYQPMVAAYFRASQTPSTTFLDKGFGYAHPSEMGAPQRKRWFRTAGENLAAAKIDDFIIRDKQLTWAQLREGIDELGVRAAFSLTDTMGGGDEDDAPRKHKGTPVFSDPVWNRENDAGGLAVGPTVDAIIESAKKRDFFFVALKYPVTARELERVYDKLQERAPHIRVVSPEVFVRLYEAHH